MTRKAKYKHSTQSALPNDAAKEISRNVWNEDPDEVGMTGHGNVVTITITSGFIVPINDMHIINGEGAANDNLDTIDNTESNEFDEIELYAGDAVITVRNGTGNIFTLSGDSILLSLTVPKRFVRRGTNWFETGGSSGSSSQLGFFGDGSDGDVVISSDTTLAETKFYNNLTIDDTFTLDGTTSPQVIYVKDTLTVNGTISMSAKGVSNDGADGADGGVTTDAGDNGIAAAAGVDAINIAIAGVVGPTGDGLGGVGPVTSNTDGPDGNVLGGGAGGSTGSPGRSGGNGANTPAPGNAASVTLRKIHSIMEYLGLTENLVGAGGIAGNGGAGGGAGGGSVNGDSVAGVGGAGGIDGVNDGDGADGGDAVDGTVSNSRPAGGGGAGGGSGGHGGGALIIVAKKIIIGATGIIEANGGPGGNGGDGGDGAASLAAFGGAGGGAAGNGGTGGNGGLVLLFYSSLVNDGLITVNGGIGGDSGIGGIGHVGGNSDGGDGGPGSGGAAPTGSSGIIIQLGAT